MGTHSSTCGTLVRVNTWSIPQGWDHVLADECSKPYFAELMTFVESERSKGDVFPPAEDVFNALAYCPYDGTNVLLLGQDPYPRRQWSGPRTVFFGTTRHQAAAVAGQHVQGASNGRGRLEPRK